MPNNPKIHYILANLPKREKRVGIYCRVNTNSMEQLQSLTVQVSHLTKINSYCTTMAVYTGDVELLKSRKSKVHYLASDNNPVIISKETFEAVQMEKVRRSNIVRDENGSQRKSKKYSSKK